MILSACAESINDTLSAHLEYHTLNTIFVTIIPRAPEGTVGWRVAHRTLGQGFKPLRCWSVPPWLGVGVPHVYSGYTVALIFWEDAWDICES
jgi:hypothetical protein